MRRTRGSVPGGAGHCISRNAEDLAGGVDGVLVVSWFDSQLLVMALRRRRSGRMPLGHTATS